MNGTIELRWGTNKAAVYCALASTLLTLGAAYLLKDATGPAKFLSLLTLPAPVLVALMVPKGGSSLLTTIQTGGVRNKREAEYYRPLRHRQAPGYRRIHTECTVFGTPEPAPKAQHTETLWRGEAPTETLERSVHIPVAPRKGLHISHPAIENARTDFIVPLAAMALWAATMMFLADIPPILAGVLCWTPVVFALNSNSSIEELSHAHDRLPIAAPKDPQQDLVARVRIEPNRGAQVTAHLGDVEAYDVFFWNVDATYLAQYPENCEAVALMAGAEMMVVFSRKGTLEEGIFVITHDPSQREVPYEGMRIRK